MRSPPTGRPIATGAGPGSSPGAGRGSTPPRGVSPPSITGAGYRSAAAGVGRRAPMPRAPCMRRPSSAGSAIRAGTSASVTASAPAVGWFPLAPREVYVPGYRTSPTYVRQINVAHVHDRAHIDRALRPEYRPHYAHQGQPHAVTVVPSNMLREGKPINRNSVRPYDRNELGQAPVKSRAPSGDWLAPPAGAARAAPRQRPGPLSATAASQATVRTLPATCSRRAAGRPGRSARHDAAGQPSAGNRWPPPRPGCCARCAGIQPEHGKPRTHALSRGSPERPGNAQLASNAKHTARRTRSSATRHAISGSAGGALSPGAAGDA